MRPRRASSGTRGGSSENPRSRSTSGISARDRKSTRLNSSHSQISYALFCFKKTNSPNYAFSSAHVQDPQHGGPPSEQIRLSNALKNVSLVLQYSGHSPPLC